MAKDHVRFMVGGRCPGLPNERLFRFEFPERPGACAEFLQAIGSRWNISLFHYRNHGAAYGRVLCGLQIPEKGWAECRRSKIGSAAGTERWCTDVSLLVLAGALKNNDNSITYVRTINN